MSHPRLEFLEPRTHLSVDATYANSWTNGPHLFIAVEYASQSGIDTATLGNADVLVRRAGSAEFSTELAGVQQLDGLNRVRATYRMRAPGNWWDSGDNGAYTSVVRAGEVGDLGGAAVAQTDLHTNNLWFPRAFASMVSSTVNSGEWLINVRFAGVQFDYIPLDWIGIGDGNLLVAGPGGPLATSLHQLQVIDGAIVATYRAVAPGGSWDSLESGRYSVSLQGGQVLAPFFPYRLGDAFLGASELWFNSPRAEGLGATNEGTAIAVRVCFTSTAAINLSTLGDEDVDAVREDGTVLAMVRATDLDGIDGNGYIAGYRLLAPGGGVSTLMHARYDFILKGGAVTDTAGGSTQAQEVESVQIFDESSAVAVAGASVESATAGSSSRHRWVDITLNLLTDALSSTFGVGAVVADVATPHGLTLSVSVISANSTPDGITRAQLRMLAPDGFINFHDNGQYSVVIREGYLLATGSTSRPARAAGTFDISGQSNPRVEILSHRFTASDWLIDVRLSDSDGIHPSSWVSLLPLFTAAVRRSADLQYYNMRFTYQSPAELQPDGSYLATLRGSAPSGVWSWRDSGTARLSMFGAITDPLSNRSGAGEMLPFSVQFDAPSATLGTAYYAAEDRWQVVVTYESPSGFTAGAFHDGDITSQWTGGGLGLARLVEANHVYGGRWSVVYEFRAQMAVGRYPISLTANAVLDTTGTAAPARVFSPLQVNFVVPGVAIASTWATREELVVQIYYAAYRGIDQTTFGIDDLTVSRGAETLTATGIIATPEDRYNRVRVAYRFAPAGGDWDTRDNGAWTVAIQPGTVRRTNGETFAGAELQTLNLYFPPPVTPRLISSTVTETTWLVNIRFEGSAPRTSSLGDGDLRILDRPYMLSSLHQLQFIDGAVVATYSFTAPGGAWDYEDNGTYTVELLSDAVRDAAGLAIPGLTFAPATFWFAQPAAYVVDSSRTGNDWLIEVHYGGVGGMNSATLGDDDLTLYRFGTAYTVTFITWDATSRRARYRVNPVNGSWTSADNGVFRVSVNENTVFGADGTAARARITALLVRPLI
jgi:hypothetical protein